MTEAERHPRCPICGGTSFEPGPRGRMALTGVLPRCSGCKSLERHRAARVLFDRLGPARFAGWSAIQFSPDPTVDPAWFGSFELSVYGPPDGIDIQQIDRPDGAYDYVGCSHVLEHVGDDRAALCELLRITSPRGFVYLNIPDPFAEEVTRDWGFPKPEKHGHWRVYGRDVALRFARYIPRQPVLAYRGTDPVTGEATGAFLLPRSAEPYRWIVDRLGKDVELFSGPSLQSAHRSDNRN
ncbi:class I SAM-dependent methyltransferase [Sinorhizobium alkalisoli]|uniref:class I SAM-dependent methyltransferase n=1 Tax=Sinorhizobium alkalisoli TaxID=1752398 RepID=UPI00178C4D96|nr:methyltransferase domain-containing protein [Sinorhizobium alkalisoli]MCA1490584.1 methyltransferase domain-containing protein [Ensifer sp. NBAIM29]